jgi:hypothetical protein
MISSERMCQVCETLIDTIDLNADQLLRLAETSNEQLLSTRLYELFGFKDLGASCESLMGPLYYVGYDVITVILRKDPMVA